MDLFGLDISLRLFVEIAVVAAGASAAWKIIRVLGKLSQLVEAQLATNGGGSLVDKVNMLTGIHEKVEEYHEEALRHFDTLHTNMEDLSKRVAKIESDGEK